MTFTGSLMQALGGVMPRNPSLRRVILLRDSWICSTNGSQLSVRVGLRQCKFPNSINQIHYKFIWIALCKNKITDDTRERSLISQVECKVVVDSFTISASGFTVLVKSLEEHTTHVESDDFRYFENKKITPCIVFCEFNWKAIFFFYISTSKQAHWEV